MNKENNQAMPSYDTQKKVNKKIQKIYIFLILIVLGIALLFFIFKIHNSTVQNTSTILSDAKVKMLSIECANKLKASKDKYLSRIDTNGKHAEQFLKNDILKCPGDTSNENISFFIIQGLDRNASKSMPYMIEKIGHHGNVISVVFVTGIVNQMFDIKNYSDILKQLEKNLTPQEKELLVKQFQVWDEKLNKWNRSVNEHYRATHK